MRRLASTLIVLASPSLATASPSFAVHATGAAALPVGDEKTEQFSWGGSAVASGEILLHDVIGVELSLGALGLSDSGRLPPTGVASTGWGFAAFSTVGPRVRPFAPLSKGDKPFSARGVWLSSGAGAALTSGDVRPIVCASLGYDVAASSIAAGPFVGYLQVVETSRGIRPDDARAIVFGLHGSFGSKRSMPRTKPSPDAAATATPSVEISATPATVDPCHAGASDVPPTDPRCRTPEPMQQTLTLEQRIRFEDGSNAITRDKLGDLGKLAAELNAHPEYERVHVVGHSDDTGPLTYNDELSRARAEAVKKRLVGLGVASSRLIVDAVGPRVPVVAGDTADARSANRRVEIEIDLAPLAMETDKERTR